MRLFLIDGTVSKCFPPVKWIKSWVFPEFLYPIKAMIFLLDDLFLDMKIKATTPKIAKIMIKGRNDMSELSYII